MQVEVISFPWLYWLVTTLSLSRGNSNTTIQRKATSDYQNHMQLVERSRLQLKPTVYSFAQTSTEEKNGMVIKIF